MGTGGDRSLAGVGVVVTRPDGEDDALAEALRARGASVVSWPALRWAPPSDPGPLAAALERLADFDWVVFTSPRAVAAVAEAAGRGSRAIQVAAVGRSTAEAAEAAGWAVAVVPTTQAAEALVDAMAAAGVGAGTRVLFPASEIARETLESGLVDLGARVTRVTAYRTLPAELDRAACEMELEAGRVHVIGFASPSAVENLRGALGEPLFQSAVAGAVVAAIGPTTAAAARAAGARRIIEARDHALEGLADRIAEWAGSQDREERDELSHQ